MENKMKNPKQIIVVRKDLINRENEKMTEGKLAAQVAHAAMAPILEKLRGGVKYENITKNENNYRLFIDVENDTPLKDWLEGSFTKIVLYVKSEQKLINLYNKIKEAGFTVCLIRDSGYTIFKEPTITCFGVEPLYPEQIDPLTKKARLL
jgi:peptidyl-tRNA hydrolase